MKDLDIGSGEAYGSAQLLALDDDTVEFEIPTQTKSGDIYFAFGQCRPNFGAGYANVLDVFSGNLLQFKTIKVFVGHEVFKTSFTIFTKTVIITDDQYFGLDSIYQDFPDKFFRTQLGEFFGKRDSD